MISEDDLIKLCFTLGLTGAGALGGYFVRFSLDLRKEAETSRIADRRDHYRALIQCLKSLNEGSRKHEEILSFEYAFLWLSASDSVIRSFNHLRHRLKDGIPEVGELVLAMRQDVGFERTQLSADEFFVDLKPEP